MTFIVADRVRDTTSGTGTSDIVVSGTAPVAYRTFSDVLGIGDTFEGTIAHQTLNEWECGLYTYSAANTITRTLVRASSNAGALVSFSAGTKDVILTPNSNHAFAKQQLFADLFLYVRTDGNDANTGLANTAGGACLTVQGAINRAYTYDASLYSIEIHIADGTYSGTFTVDGSFAGHGKIYIIGNTVTPANVLLTTGTGDLALVTNNAVVGFSGFKVTHTGSGAALKTTAFGVMQFNAIEFGTINDGVQIYCDSQSVVTAVGSYTISGPAQYHILAQNGASYTSGGTTITITGTPAFTFGYIIAGMTAICYCPFCTFLGTATGQRYNISLNAAINTIGGGANYFPGDSAGVTATGGQYA